MCQFFFRRKVLPSGYRALHVELANNKDAEFEITVKWAIVVKKDIQEETRRGDRRGSVTRPGAFEDVAAILVFRGSKTLADMAVDLGCAPYFAVDVDMRVHVGIWVALHSQPKSVVDQIINVLKTHLYNVGRCGMAHRIVISGHSLGGGYALLSALELFARGQDADGFLIDPAAVVTFGAPMVIVPGVKNYLWQTLHARAVVVINAWDACPRTPSCEAWMFDVLPSVSVRTRMLSNKTVVEQALRPVWGTVSRYDACGTLCFVDAVRPGKVHI